MLLRDNIAGPGTRRPAQNNNEQTVMMMNGGDKDCSGLNRETPIEIRPVRNVLTPDFTS